jgi:hypothetical protein
MADKFKENQIDRWRIDKISRRKNDSGAKMRWQPARAHGTLVRRDVTTDDDR